MPQKKSLRSQSQTSSGESLRRVLTERGSQYGDFTTQGIISQRIKEAIQCSVGYRTLQPHQQEALDIIAHKISRILNGNPHFRDSWFDIAGYAQLCADRCPEKENE